MALSVPIEGKPEPIVETEMPKDQHPNSLSSTILENLPRILPDFLPRQRWFGGKARTIKAATILETIKIPFGDQIAYVVLSRINYTEGNDETYAIPFMREGPQGEGAAIASADSKSSLKLETQGAKTVLYDAFLDNDFSRALFESIRDGKSYQGTAGELVGRPTSMFRDAKEGIESVSEPHLMKGEQSNTSVRYGERSILKFFRRLEQGMNPDVEIGTFLTEKASFGHSPAVCGILEYRHPQMQTCALGILQDFVLNQGDAWRYTLSVLNDYLVGAPPKEAGSEPLVRKVPLSESRNLEIPDDVPGEIGDYWESAGLLGRRTGELHVALASDSADPDFRPEQFSADFQRSQYDSMRGLANQVLRVLEKRFATLDVSIREDARRVLDREKEMLGRFEAFANHKLTANCIRIHGDYHLGQVLYTGSDFVIIDFEGEPARPLAERRKKRCALQDVAGMLRSFHYAAYTAHYSQESNTDPQLPGRNKSLLWTQYWLWWVSVQFLQKYLSAAANSQFLPSSQDEFAILLDAYLLEKAIYELGYELNNRPDWVRLPVQGILELLQS